MSKLKSRFFLVFLSILFWFPLAFAADLQVHFIDVGQGDSIFIISPSGKKLLIDAGKHSAKSDARNPFSYLRKLKEEGQLSDFRIDYAIITHPHDDHYGGYKYLCSKDESSKDFSIAHLYYSVEAEKPSYGGFLNCLQALQKKTESSGQISARGPPVDIGDEIKITILYPFEPIVKPNKDKNDDSVVLKITYNKVSFLLTGDASSNVEKQLLDKDIKSNVLKLGHHGSKTSSSSDFLNTVKPDGEFYVVISADDKDYRNKYGHPNKQALDRVHTLDNVDLLRTDLEGTIVFTTDGESINVKTQKKVASEKQLWKPGVKPKPPEK